MWSSVCVCVCVCVWLARGSNRQEEQVAPRRVLPGWWVRIGRSCPFTIHVPSASTDSDCIPVTKKEQRDGGRKVHRYVTESDNSAGILHFILAVEFPLTNLALCPAIN